MSKEFNQRVLQILDESLELPKEKRKRFLDFACADSPEVRSAVEALLEDVIRGTEPRNRDETLQRIGRYEIGSLIGQGSTGKVYMALDPVIGRRVALKVMLLNSAVPAESKAAEDRLFSQASAAGRLGHRGVVTTFDVDREENRLYLVMELVEGSSLLEMLKSGKMPRQQALDVLRQVAEALDYVHGLGIVHCGIKPAKILLHRGTQPKVSDFSMSRFLPPNQSLAGGTILGTPAYMSPEQIQNLVLTGQSDQFSFALVAYEMLTGTRAFVQEEVVALLYAIVNGERPKASNVDPTLPAMVDEVFYRAMSKRPEDRFANCSAFVNALQSAMAVAELAPTYGRELPGYVAAPSRPSLPASPALPASSAEWNSVYRQKWAARAFDCFMCYHSTDRKAVLEVYERLIKKGILPWMDHQHLQPGKSWHQVVESVISKVPAVVVFMGGSGHGPWQQTELNAALEEMIERKARVVPVILPDTVGTPKLPFLLRSYSWVDLRFHEPDPIDKLIWGITDRHKDD